MQCWHVKCSAIGRVAFWMAAVVGLVLVAAFGCRRAATQATPNATQAQQQPAAPQDREFWDVYYMQGARVGYGRTRVFRKTEDGKPRVRIEGTLHLAVMRLGQPMQSDMTLQATETPEGELLEFRSEIALGSTPMVTRGRVVGERLVLETSTQGKTVATSIPWSPEFGGPLAVEQSLARSPMRPGEHRTIRALLPELNQVATIELAAFENSIVRLGRDLSGAWATLTATIDAATPR